MGIATFNSLTLYLKFPQQIRKHVTKHFTRGCWLSDQLGYKYPCVEKEVIISFILFHCTVDLLTMQSFVHCLIFALEETTSHIKLIIVKNLLYKTLYQTICVWRKNDVAVFEAGKQVIITFLFYSIYSCTVVD